MENYNNVFNENENDLSNKVSMSGLIIKTLVGVMIAFFIAIPNLMNGKLFLKWMYKFDGFSYLFIVLGVTIVLGIIWATLYRMLRKDLGFVMNWIVFIATSAFAGLFLGNALIFAVLFIYSYSALNAMDVVNALRITTFATFIAVIGGVVALPRLKLDGPAIKFFKNISTLLVTLTFVSGIIWSIGYIFHIFGMDFILKLFYSAIYGLGPISMILSVLAIIGAEFMFLIVLSRSMLAIGKEPKHMEYYYSIILVNAIIRIYIEIFKLVLKIIANASRD